MISTIEYLMATGTLAGHVVMAISILLLVCYRTRTHRFIATYVTPHNYVLIFLSTLGAMLGSLFFSEVAKIPPCDLCWYQRIFMYPQPFMLYIAMIRKERITPYLFVMNIAGLAIAAYQYVLQLFPGVIPAPCKPGGISCTAGYTFYFGYITIPLMSLTVFLFNILLLTIYSRKNT